MVPYGPLSSVQRWGSAPTSPETRRGPTCASGTLEPQKPETATRKLVRFLNSQTDRLQNVGLCNVRDNATAVARRRGSGRAESP